MRQALGRPVLLRCSLLRGSPQRIASALWRFKGQLLPPPPAVPVAAEAPDHSELRLDAVTRDSSGSYECSVSNDVGSAACLFQVSGERPVGPAPPNHRHLGPGSGPARPPPLSSLPTPGLDPCLSKTRPCLPAPTVTSSYGPAASTLAHSSSAPSTFKAHLYLA